jgi:hypothetical protein
MTITSINLIPVNAESEKDWLIDEILKKFEVVVGVLDKYCEKYLVDEPWKEEYALNGKYYLYKVSTGSIGRIKTTRDAVVLGISFNGAVKYHHFACGALYKIFRYARAFKRSIVYVKETQKWVNDMLNGKVPNTRFIETVNMFSDESNEEAE